MPSRSNGLAAEMQGVRTLALVGASAAGKTTLAEAMLQKAGAIGATGSVERGNTVSDHDPIERRMQHSLNASVMHLTHAATRIHLIDTPGGPDFLGQSCRRWKRSKPWRSSSMPPPASSRWRCA